MGSFYIGTPFLGQKVTELETALTAANAAITANAGNTATLQAWASDRVKYAYPNGGSEGDEKALSLATTYTAASPFGEGVNFDSVPEYYSPQSLSWEEMSTGFYGGDGTSYGVVTYARAESGLVVIVTKTTSHGYEVVNFGAGFQAITNAQYMSVKWRIKCIKQE